MEYPHPRGAIDQQHVRVSAAASPVAVTKSTAVVVRPSSMNSVPAVRGGDPGSPAEDAGAPGETMGVPEAVPEWWSHVVPQPPEFGRPSPRYLAGLDFDALLLLLDDLLATRRLLLEMESLRAEHHRHWSGDWWAFADLQRLKESWRRQKKEFRSAVDQGLATRCQRSYLLRRAGSV